MDPRLFKPKQAGDPISADEWNALVKLASRELRGPNIITDEQGWLMVPTTPAGPVRLLRIDSLLAVTPVKIRARAINANDDPFGQYFTVYVFAYELVEWGEHTPPVAVGDDIPVARFPPDGPYWCMWPFIGTCAYPS